MAAPEEVPVPCIVIEYEEMVWVKRSIVFQVMKVKPLQRSFGLVVIHQIRRHINAAVFVIAPEIEARAQAEQWGLVCHSQY